MTRIKDLAWLLLIGLLIPVWMVVGLAGLAIIVVRQLHLWLRGNTTDVSSGQKAPTAWEDLGTVPSRR